MADTEKVDTASSPNSENKDNVEIEPVKGSATVVENAMADPLDEAVEVNENVDIEEPAADEESVEEKQVIEDTLASIDDETETKTVQVLKVVRDEVCDDSSYNARKGEVEVWATAIFDNSQKEFLVQADFNSLENVLRGAKHLNENILKIEPLQQSNRKFRTGQFKHSLGLKLLVKTEKYL